MDNVKDTIQKAQKNEVILSYFYRAFYLLFLFPAGKYFSDEKIILSNWYPAFSLILTILVFALLMLIIAFEKKKNPIIKLFYKYNIKQPPWVIPFILLFIYILTAYSINKTPWLFWTSLIIYIIVIEWYTHRKKKAYQELLSKTKENA